MLIRGNGKLKRVLGYPESIRDIEQTWLENLFLVCAPFFPKVTDEIRLLLQRYKNIDCFSVTETHLSAQVSDDEIGIQSYTGLYYLPFGLQAQTKGAVLLFMSQDGSSKITVFVWGKNTILKFLARSLLWPLAFVSSEQ